MFKRILKIFLILWTAILLVFFQTFILYTFYHPFNKFNLFIFVASILLIGWDYKYLIFLAFVFGFFLELFGGNAFGIILVSLVASMVITKNFYYLAITNRSWYSALLLSSFFVLTYRLIYIFIIYLLSIMDFIESGLRLDIWRLFVWELLITASFTTIVVIITSRFTNRFQTKVIT